MKKLDRVIIPDVPKLREELETQAFHEGTGIIKYDPKRGKMKRRTEWWAVLDCDDGITDYYRSLVNTEYGIKLCQPSWGAHVSIIRGEKPKPHLAHLWKKYDGLEVKFKYGVFQRHNGDTRVLRNHEPGEFWFLDVYSDELTNIRKELELPFDWKLHLTIGRKW